MSSSVASPDVPAGRSNISLKDDEAQKPSTQEAGSQKISEKEAEAQKKAEEDKNLAQRMSNILQQTIERIKPICERITEVKSHCTH